MASGWYCKEVALFCSSIRISLFIFSVFSFFIYVGEFEKRDLIAQSAFDLCMHLVTPGNF